MISSIINFVYNFIQELNLHDYHCMQNINMAKIKENYVCIDQKLHNGYCIIHSKNHYINICPSALSYEEIDISPIYVPLPEQTEQKIKLFNKLLKKKKNKKFN